MFSNYPFAFANMNVCCQLQLHRGNLILQGTSIFQRAGFELLYVVAPLVIPDPNMYLFDDNIGEPSFEIQELSPVRPQLVVNEVLRSQASDNAWSEKCRVGDDVLVGHCPKNSKKVRWPAFAFLPYEPYPVLYAKGPSYILHFPHGCYAGNFIDTCKPH